jgi:hypothetical protein
MDYALLTGAFEMGDPFRLLRLSRQHVCLNSPGLIDQNRRQEVSGVRSCAELAPSFRRRQDR